MIDILDTGIRNVRNVDRFLFGKDSIGDLDVVLSNRRKSVTDSVIYLIDEYFERLDPIFDTISACEAGKSIDELLEGSVCHSGFRRLN